MPAIDFHVSQGSTPSIQALQFKAQARPRVSNFEGTKTGHIERLHPRDDLLNERCLAHSGFSRYQCLSMSQPHRAIFFNTELIDPLNTLYQQNIHFYQNMDIRVCLCADLNAYSFFYD